MSQYTNQSKAKKTLMQKFTIEKIRSWALAQCRVWGVGWESDLPKEFIISQHAEERLLERMTKNRDKLEKIVVRAWRSKLAVPSNVNLPRKYERVYYRYRWFGGYLFVFQIILAGRNYSRFQLSQKKLITVYNPKTIWKNTSKD